MTIRSVRYLWHAGLLSLVMVLGSGITRPALGQFQTTDPYNPYNMYYKPFTYPIRQNVSASLPNQARIDELGMGARAPGFVESIDGADLFGRGVGRLEGGSVVPGRYYQPNEGDSFYDDQMKREAKYFEAMGEKDRRKRAKLLREYRQMTQKAARGASPSSVRSAKRKAAAGDTAAAVGSTAATAPTAPAGEPEEEMETTTPAPLRRRPSDLLVPRAGRSRGGLLRNPESTRPRSSTPSDVLDRSLNTESKPAGSIDTPGSDAPR